MIEKSHNIVPFILYCFYLWEK